MAKQKRGQRAFGKQPGQRNNDRWDQDVVKLEKPPMRKPHKIRPVGGILTAGIHYLKFKSPRDGQFTGFMVLCPNWDLESQEDQDKGCPVCRDFHRNLQIDDKRFDYLKMPQKYRYLFHAFNVTNIENGIDPVFGCVETHALGIQQIEDAMLTKGTQPDDPQHGYILHWLRKESQQKQFKEEIKFTAGDNCRVKEQEDGVWKIKVGKKIVTGTEQDLLSVILKPPTAKELEKKLADLGLYAVLDKAVGGRNAPDTSSAPDDLDEETAADDEWNEKDESAPEEDNSEDAAEDENWDEDDTKESTDTAEEDSENPDDDDWNESEDDAPEADQDADDSDEDDNWDDDEAEEEQEPPKKKKKAAKKKAAKKPATKKKATKKKAAKKPVEEVPEDDGDADDDDDWD